MTVIHEQEQLDTDFDWFCLDEAGEIGHFTTAGFKHLPPSVANCAEDLKFITDYFFETAPTIGSHHLDTNVFEERPEYKKNPDRTGGWPTLPSLY